MISHLRTVTILLENFPVDRNVAAIKDFLLERFGESFTKQYRPFEWARNSYSLRLIGPTSRSVLDVGTGAGIFINAAARSGRFERVAGIDVVTNNFFSKIVPNFEHNIQDAESMRYEDGEFDTVTCMEVIEHLPDGKMENVIAQLRRIARKQIIISVPFGEPLPLPSYHLQRFDAERVTTMFPNAKYSLLLKYPINRVPWLVINEKHPEIAEADPKSVPPG